MKSHLSGKVVVFSENKNILISIGAAAGTPASQQREFKLVDITKLFWIDLPNITRTQSYSAIEFLNGVRKSEYFRKAWLLILDFDDGLTIEEVKKIFKPYFGYIATTKSHRKSEKNGKPIESRDRFRLILFLEKPIENPEEFKIVMTNLITEFGADQACKDLARFYFPNPTQEFWFLTEGKQYFDIQSYKVARTKSSVKKNTLAIQKNIIKSEKYTPIIANTIIVSDDGTSATAIEWYDEMQVDDKTSIHCPFPEHNDTNPSAFMAKTDKQSLFCSCSSCGRKGFYNRNEKSIIVHSEEIFVQPKKQVHIGIKQFSNALIQQLFYKGEYDTVNIVNQMLSTTIPITSYVGTLYLYTDDYWRKHKDKDTEKKVFIKTAIEKITGERALNGQIDTVYKELMNEYIDSTESDEILINFDNTVLKICNGNFETIAHSHLYGFKYKLDFPYNVEATCPKVDNFLFEVIGEQEAIDMLFEFIGSCFISNNFFKLESSIFLLGSGSNGKSVLLDLLRHLFGKDNISTVSLKDMSDPNRRFAMVGKLLNIAAEGSNKKFDSEDFKSMVSREPLPVRQLYSDPMETDDFPRPIFATNSLPWSGGDMSGGLPRRVKIIIFDKIFSEDEQDKQLLQKLLPELSGVMNRVLEGMTRLLANKQLTYSNKVDKAGKQYERQINPVKYFIAEMHYEIGSDTTPIYDIKVLYAEFVKFCLSVGIQKLSQRNFTPLMNNIFGKQVHSNKRYGWRITKNDDIKIKNHIQSPYEN